MAALSLSALSFGLPAFALVKVVAPAFYARQDTKTPVRAGIVAMIANMVMNVVFVALLFSLWHTPEQGGDGWLDALAKVPGLHMGLALASALASYLNLAQLWLGLRRDGIHVGQPGWAAHLVRLGIACAVMVAVIVACLVIWPDWSAWDTATRCSGWGVPRCAVCGGISAAGVEGALGSVAQDCPHPSPLPQAGEGTLCERSRRG